MKTSAKRAAAIALLAGAAAWGFVPAIGQDSPESLLPPGFDEPAAPAPSPPPSQPSRQPDSPSAPSAPTSGSSEPVSDIGAAGNDSGETRTVDLTRYELPEFAKHSLDRIGAYAWGNPQFPARAFGSNGRFVGGLMRRVNAPVASRWASIALRRALLSRVDTPADVNGADFAADRAWLLIRMGESVAARAVVQDVDAENYTPWMYQVAMQSALASADPGAICSYASDGQKVLSARGWGLSRAMCAGLAGKPNEAGQLLGQASARSGAGNIDNLLAEKVLGTGAQGRRAVTIEWDGVNTLTAWRWGLATATGETIPDGLYNTAGAQVRFWHALAAGPTPSSRAADAELAAAQGVFSNAGLVDLFGEIDESGEGGSALTTARDLRRAYTESDPLNRIAAMKSLWDGPESARRKYARLVLTARAAARISPSSAFVGDSDRLVASMLTAGFENAAQAWRPFVGRSSDGWVMLEMADPAANARTSVGDFDAYRGSAATRKAQLSFAGLAGLGRFSDGQAESLAAALNVEIGAANAWTRAIDAAAARREAGTVALLAAVGMQSRFWEHVTPEALFHVTAALRAVGLTPYARMIAVEAVTRA